MKNTTPQTTADMVFTNTTTENQINAILSGIFPFPSSGKAALCLFGTHGTGKTTYSNIFCKEFERAKSNTELACNPHFVSCQKTEGIDSILKRCKKMTEFVSWNKSDYHYFIFDEVDNLTDTAQKALKAFLNTSNIVCVLTTNHLDQLDKGMLSRCINVNFNAAEPEAIRTRVHRVLHDNGLQLGNDEIDKIIQTSDGSWREILPTATYLATPLSKSPNTPLRIVK